jgi:hypothetical protein
MNTIDERNIDPVEEMARVVESILLLTSWGFLESYRSASPGKLIYDSRSCRVKLVWEGWDYGGGNSISIYYGRLHAPNEKTTMIWRGEECHSWHDFDLALHFLDERTPVYAGKLQLTHQLIDPFYEEDFRKKFRRRQPEWLAQMHATIWRHYGERFFELFDLRRPDLWEKYRQFLKEVYDIKGRSPRIRPPLDKVC